MLMKDFIKRVLGQIDNLKRYDDSVLSPNELVEAQRHIDYLRQLLNQYADSDVVITKANVADCTQPFLSFLAQRWLRIAKSGATYAKAPNTRANKACKILADQLLMIDQQVDYKNRDSNSYLIPSIKITTTSFIDYALNDIETFVRDNPGNVDHYVYFESVYALNRLKTVLEAMPKSTDLVTKESLEPLFQLMRERYDLIHGTDADYSINPQTDVNNIYTHLARLMQLTLELNGQPHASIDANRFLMPDVRVERRQTSLQTRLLAKLTENSSQVEASNDFLGALIAQKTTAATFAARMKAVLAKLEKDDSKDMPLLAYLESRRTIRSFIEILNEQANIDQPLTKTQLEAYINFLSNRWNEIDGTLASYPAAPQLYTRAYALCHQLVSHIVLAAFELGHLNRDPAYLLMRTPHDVQPEVAANNLRLTLTAEYKNINELAAEMLNLPQEKWREFINLFDCEKMVNLLSNGKPVIDEALKTDFQFDKNEARSRALLLSLFLAYGKTRQQVPSDRIAYGASVISIFTSKIPTLKQKTDAVEAVCDRLISGASIIEIANGLNDAQSPLYPHRAALQDKRLKGCWDQLELAARQLPAPEVLPSVKVHI